MLLIICYFSEARTSSSKIKASSYGWRSKAPLPSRLEEVPVLEELFFSKKGDEGAMVVVYRRSRWRCGRGRGRYWSERRREEGQKALKEVIMIR